MLKFKNLSKQRNNEINSHQEESRYTVM